MGDEAGEGEVVCDSHGGGDVHFGAYVGYVVGEGVNELDGIQLKELTSDDVDLLIFILRARRNQARDENQNSPRRSNFRESKSVADALIGSRSVITSKHDADFSAADIFGSDVPIDLLSILGLQTQLADLLAEQVISDIQVFGRSCSYASYSCIVVKMSKLLVNSMRHSTIQASRTPLQASQHGTLGIRSTVEGSEMLFTSFLAIKFIQGTFVLSPRFIFPPKGVGVLFDRCLHIRLLEISQIPYQCIITVFKTTRIIEISGLSENKF